MVDGAAGELAKSDASLRDNVEGNRAQVFPPSEDSATPLSIDANTGPGDPAWARTARTSSGLETEPACSRASLFSVVTVVAPLTMQ